MMSYHFMKKLLIYLLVLMRVTCGSSPAEELRDWESANGKKIVAALVSYDAAKGTLRIRRVDGTEYTLSREKLSQADQTFLENFAKRRDEELAAAAKAAAEAAGKTVAHKVPGDPEVQFHVYHPTTYGKGGKMPMIILFSPSGGGPGILNSFRAAAEECGWIAVGCGHLRNGMEEKESHEVFSRMLPAIEKAVPLHDPGRLYLGGMSGGAMRAFVVSADFDRPWKGVVSCGGWLGAEPRRNHRKHMAVAFVNGDNDRGANSWVARDTQILESDRSQCKLFEFPGGHVVAPKPVLVEAMKWVAAETKKN
jgi:nucleotide-binding universal stress UspA family protein